MSASLNQLDISENNDLLEGQLSGLLPSMDLKSHKGEAGRIGIVGGCEEYTGAPYFAAISALKVGCDLSHIFCTKAAAPVIKSYSPELIVHPLLGIEERSVEIEEWMQRLHSIVIGPGLGRDPQVLHSTMKIIEKAKEMDLPLVIDADGLHIVTEYPNIIKSYKKAILTPNIVEFTRLYKALTGNIPEAASSAATVAEVANLLGNITVVQKGQRDIISNGLRVLLCKTEGSPRRCGGQGDLLSGSLAVFNYWCHKALAKSQTNELLNNYGVTLCASFAACHLTRLCNQYAFAKYHRSTTTTDMIPEIHHVLNRNFK